VNDHERLTPVKFSYVDALDAANEWVFKYTRLGCLTLIGVFLIVIKIGGWLGSKDTPWINVIWPFIMVVVVVLVVSIVFRLKYHLKIEIESEFEAKEYNKIMSKGKRWISSGMPNTILHMNWTKKK
jgi:hypothetical protein